MSARISQLIQSQKEMTAALSHEMRTPLARVRFAVAVLEGEVDERLHLQLRAVSNDVRQIDELISDMLDYARLDHPGLRMDCQSVAVEPWLGQVLATCPPHERNVDTVRRDDLESLWMEPRLMELALSNLLANALRYARRNVRIEVARENGLCRLVVEDDGEGIPEADRAAVFRAFTRLDTSRNRETGGFGLGLAIVARIAALHGGRVIADSSRQPRRRATHAGVAGALAPRAGPGRRAFGARRFGAELRIAAAWPSMSNRAARLARLEVAAEVHAAHHALPRELIGPGLQLPRLRSGTSMAEQIGHRIAKGRVAAGVGQIAPHVVDARIDARLDLVGSQTPETVLGRAHVWPHIVFDALGEAGATRGSSGGALPGRIPARRRTARSRSCGPRAPRPPVPACARPASPAVRRVRRASRPSPRRGRCELRGELRRRTRRVSDGRSCCCHQRVGGDNHQRGRDRGDERGGGSASFLAQPRERSTACCQRARRAAASSRSMRGSKRRSSVQSAASSCLRLPESDAEAGEGRGAEGRGLGVRGPQHRHA